MRPIWLIGMSASLAKSSCDSFLEFINRKQFKKIVPSDEQKKDYKMNVNKAVAYVYILVALLPIITGCQSSQNKRSLKKKGFIIVDQRDFWYFVPVASVDNSDCFDDLASKQFGKGLQFDPSVIPNLSYIQRTFDTLVCDRLEVTPVEIEFALKPDHLKLYESRSKEENWNFKFRADIKKKQFEFTYNVFPISIDTIRPLFCLTRKASHIRECKCIHDESDQLDYLFKICNYLKAQDRYSDLPCRYRIKNVVSDTLAGRAVTKVQLTCCYLGDVAYFDGQTNEIISVSYGGKWITISFLLTFDSY